MDIYSINCAAFSLQLFAEGGGAAGGDGGAAGEGTGVQAAAAGQNTSVPAAGVQGQEVAGDPREAEFERLIKGDYKDLYDKRVSDTIQRRLKSSKETVDKYNALAPTLDMLAGKYGVDASDIEALNKAIQEDDSYYEEEALNRGLTVQQLKEIKRMERENTQLRREMEQRRQQEQADAVYARWMQEAESTKQVYPSFDLQAEARNPQFMQLLQSNVPLRTAYEVIHKDEIISGAMQFTAQTIAGKVANSVAAGQSRPVEGGLNKQGAFQAGIDPAHMSKAQRLEYAQRAARGERITFR